VAARVLICDPALRLWCKRFSDVVGADLGPVFMQRFGSKAVEISKELVLVEELSLNQNHLSKKEHL